MGSDPLPRRLKTFSDSTINGLASFDSGGSAYDELELSILKMAYDYLAKTLGVNLAELRRAGLVTGDLVFDIVDDRRVNAFAWKKEGYDAICFNAGLPLCLFLMFSRIVQFSEAFPWVADQTVDQLRPPTLNFLPTSFQEVDPVHLFPINAQRQELALCLWKWSLLFTLFHELGHLVHGHVEYSLKQSKRKAFGEIGDRLSGWDIFPRLRGEQWFELRRAQEQQADKFAMALVFLPLFHNAPTLAPLFSSVSKRGFNRVPYVFGFVMAAVFTLFAFLEGVVHADRTGCTHPSPFARLGTAVFAPQRLLFQTRPVSEQYLLCSEMFESWRELDNLMEITYGGIFRGFFADTKPVIPVSLQTLLSEYDHNEEWEKYDRVGNVGGGLQVFVIP